jgi:hypothetical protein
VAEAQRPYLASSIVDLEAIFDTQGTNVSVLSRLVHELSIRKTARARRLLALVAERLAEIDPKEDNSDVPRTVDDDFPASEDDDQDVPEKGATASHDGTADRDKPPDDRKQPKQLSRIRPVGTPGLPSAWVRSLNADRPLNITANADVPQIYAAALAALIAEIKTTGAGQKRYELENGIRAEGNESIYEFPFTDDADLFEDAKVEVEVSGRRVDGSIVSISSGRLWLAIGEDLGRSLQRVVLLVDATALLEALKQRIEDNYKGEIALNRGIADAVIGKKIPPADPISISAVPSDISLDSAKRDALQRALSTSVTYVWGPPGCGKTL